MIGPLSNRIAARDPEMAHCVAEAVERDGYAIVTDVLDREACTELVSEIDSIETGHDIPHGANDFEGFRTRRIFNLIARGPRFRELVLDETILEVSEAILGVDFLLSGTTSMHISPGETSQLLHCDDGMITLPRPHVATMITTLWALCDFTISNGATRLVPGSHLCEEMPRAGERHESLAAEMPAGSVLVLHGSTWHGGGSNATTNAERYGVSIQFVAGWCRQQQNLMLGTPAEVVALYPRRLQQLIGYSIFRNVMGHVNREHPLKLLGVEERVDMVWDRMESRAPEDT
jgi:ectoine hydroxylase-related dioxygenase (phytanoyl-CoA dioxygenase family)